MGLLDGQRAVITGGGSGIGRATARRMAAEGAQVAVLDLEGERAAAVADEVGGPSYAVDVTDGEALGDAVNAAASELGGISIMFNNAGVGTLSPLHDYPFEEWDRIVRVNLHGVFHGFRAAAPLILAGGGGSI